MNKHKLIQFDPDRRRYEFIHLDTNKYLPTCILIEESTVGEALNKYRGYSMITSNPFTVNQKDTNQKVYVFDPCLDEERKRIYRILLPKRKP